MTDTRTLGGNFGTPGAIQGAITLTTSGEGLVGESPINVVVNYSAQVYSGKAQWSTTNESWSAPANWVDTIGGGPSGSPGLSGFAGDSATFGPGCGGTVNVTLDSAAPLLGGLVLNSTSTSYAILQGAGTTGLTLAGSGDSPVALTVVSGTHSVLAPIVLDADFDVASSGSLTLAGNISDLGIGAGLTLSGEGTLIVSGINSYGGGTIVEDGTLVATNPAALPAAGNVAVGAEAASIFAPVAATAQAADAPTPVPEPSTLALLGFAAIRLMRWKRPGRSIPEYSYS